MKEQSNQSFQDLASVEFSLLTLSSSCSFATQASVYSKLCGCFAAGEVESVRTFEPTARHWRCNLKFY
ncbi:hypothetical protein ACFX1R_006574 [Malus domestica]